MIGIFILLVLWGLVGIIAYRIPDWDKGIVAGVSMIIAGLVLFPISPFVIAPTGGLLPGYSSGMRGLRHQDEP